MRALEEEQGGRSPGILWVLQVALREGSLMGLGLLDSCLVWKISTHGNMSKAEGSF